MTKKRGGRARQLAMWVMLATVACTSRTGLDPRDHELSTCWPDCQQTWGDFAATLDVPDCPASNPVLTVNTTAEELDGGEGITDPSQAGSLLSLHEALWIAANHGTPQTISFDEAVFPAHDPKVIELNRRQRFPAALQDICIDGRERGVVVAWQEKVDAPCAPQCGLPALIGGSLLVGVTLQGPGTDEQIYASNGAQVAACRISAIHVGVYATDADIGPGNVLSSPVWAISIEELGSGATRVHGNYFGYDPLTRAVLDDGFPSPGFAMKVDEPAYVHDNVFGYMSAFVGGTASAFGAPVILQRNYFGVDAEGRSMSAGTYGPVVSVQAALPVRVGPGNVIRGVAEYGVSAIGDAVVEITENSMTGNGSGIRPCANAPPAPTVTQATRTGVDGTCDAAGRLEVFSDPGDQGETFIGAMPCVVGTWSMASDDLTAGRNVTATLTDATGRTSAFSAPVSVP